MAALGSVVAEPVVDMGVKSVRADGGATVNGGAAYSVDRILSGA